MNLVYPFRLRHRNKEEKIWQLRKKRPHSTPEGRWADVKRMFGGKSGGRATHGYGKAYMKGGKVK